MPKPNIARRADVLLRKHNLDRGEPSVSTTSRSLVNRNNEVILDAGACDSPSDVLAELGGVTQDQVSVPFRLNVLQEAVRLIDDPQLTPATQLKILWLGDSLGGQLSTFLTEYSPGNVTAWGNLVGLLPRQYGYAGAGLSGLSASVAGTVTANTADFANSLNGKTWDISGGDGVVTFANYSDSEYVPANKFSAYIVHESGAGHYKVEYLAANGTWTEVAGMSDVDANSGGAAVLTVKTAALSRGRYKLRVSHVSGAAVTVVGAYLRDESTTGVVNLPWNQSGTSVASQNGVTESFFSAIVDDIDPQCCVVAFDDANGDAAMETFANRLLGIASNPDIIWRSKWEPATAPEAVQAQNEARRVLCETLGINWWNTNTLFGGGPAANAAGLIDGDDVHWSPSAWYITARNFAVSNGLLVPRANRFAEACAVKLQDKSITNSATMATDEELQVWLNPGRYVFRFFGWFTVAGGTPGLRATVNATATLAGSLSGRITTDTNGTAHSVRSYSAFSGNRIGASVGPAAGGQALNVQIEGVMQVTAAGLFFVQWAQEAADVSNATTMKAGSALVVKRVG